MPELPEIAHLGRTLEAALPGSIVQGVRLSRPDIVRRADARTRRPQTRVRRRDLLLGERIERLQRHGKELAIVARGGAAICVHLGMSGQLLHLAPRARPQRSDHVHCVWQLGSRGGGARGRLVFRDPRRFGGLWCYGSMDELRAVRWSRLGPDGLAVDTRSLRRKLARTRRSVKAALLDQGVVAGIGNIYADEILFRAGVHPQSISAALPADRVRTLAGEIRRVLAAACRHGGSTIRDYVDGNGSSGSYASRHRVYGRGGLPCTACGQPLRAVTEAQRTTVFCPGCQDLYLGI